MGDGIDQGHRLAFVHRTQDSSLKQEIKKKKIRNKPTVFIAD